MSTLTVKPPKVLGNVFATGVSFGKDVLQVQLSDGRGISIPLEWFPGLRDATKRQRENWRLIGRGVGIHWPDVDEDISVEGLLTDGNVTREKLI